MHGSMHSSAGLTEQQWGGMHGGDGGGDEGGRGAGQGHGSGDLGETLAVPRFLSTMMEEQQTEGELDHGMDGGGAGMDFGKGSQRGGAAYVGEEAQSQADWGGEHGAIGVDAGGMGMGASRRRRQPASARKSPRRRRMVMHDSFQ